MLSKFQAYQAEEARKDIIKQYKFPVDLSNNGPVMPLKEVEMITNP